MYGLVTVDQERYESITVRLFDDNAGGSVGDIRVIDTFVWLVTTDEAEIFVTFRILSCIRNYMTCFLITVGIGIGQIIAGRCIGNDCIRIIFQGVGLVTVLVEGTDKSRIFGSGIICQRRGCHTLGFHQFPVSVISTVSGPVVVGLKVQVFAVVLL